MTTWVRSHVADIDGLELRTLAAGLHRRGGGAVCIGHAPDGRAARRDPGTLARGVVFRRPFRAAACAGFAAGCRGRRSLFRAHVPAHAVAAGDPAAAGVRPAGDHLVVGVRSRCAAERGARMETHGTRRGLPGPDAPTGRVGAAGDGAVLLAPSGPVRRSGPERMAARSRTPEF